MKEYTRVILYDVPKHLKEFVDLLRVGIAWRKGVGSLRMRTIFGTKNMQKRICFIFIVFWYKGTGF